MTPSIRLHGDKVEAAKWVRRGRAELQRLIKIAENAGVPITNRRIEFNDYVTCNVSKWDGVYVIDITATKRLEEAEEGVSEEELKLPEQCYPSFIVYRDYAGFKYETPPEGGAPVLTQQTDDGHLLHHNGKHWVGIDNETDKFRGGTTAWYHVKDNMDKYVHKALYQRCNLVSWDWNPWVGLGEIRKGTWSNTFYFQGEAWKGPGGCVIAACLLPHPQSVLNNDYFYTFSCATPTVESGDTWTEEFFIARCKVTDNPSTPSWETIKSWKNLDYVNLFPDVYQYAKEWAGGPNIKFRVPAMSAYIDKKGVMKYTITAPWQVIDAPEVIVGSYRQNGIAINPAGYPTGWAQVPWNSTTGFPDAWMPHTLTIDLVTGDVKSVVNNGRASIQLSIDRGYIMENQPILGTPVPEFNFLGHCYCGFDDEESDIWKVSADPRPKKWNAQGHHERGNAHMKFHDNHTSSQGYEESGVFGGADALYTYGIEVSPYIHQASGEGTSEKLKYTVVPSSPNGWDGIPVWNHSTYYYSEYSPKEAWFVVKKDGGEHFRMQIHRAWTESTGHGFDVTVNKTSGGTAGITMSPFVTGGTVEDDWNRVPSPGHYVTQAIQRTILWYHPMVSKALYMERDMTAQGGGSSGFYLGSTKVGEVRVKFGDQLLAKWTLPWQPPEGINWWHANEGSGALLNIANNHDLHHCNGESQKGPTFRDETLSASFGWANWGLHEFPATGVGGFSDRINVESYRGLGVGSLKPWGFANGLPGVNFTAPTGLHAHTIKRYDIGGNDLERTRLCFAVHNSSDMTSDGNAPYILFIPSLENIRASSTIDDFWEAGWGFVPQGQTWLDFDEDAPAGWFFSNCLTLEQMKRLTKRTSDYPVDFGVI